MKSILLSLLMLFTVLGYGQINYYTFNNGGALWAEEKLKTAFEEMRKADPQQHVLVPTIYHKVVKNDSIINYVTFSIEKGNRSGKADFKFTFKQDSVFLLLDKKLPSFKLTDLEGHEFSSDKMIGKPALLNYWSIFCIPCIEEMPQLSELKDKYGSEMNFIALTENTCEKDDLVNFLNKHPFNYYVLQNAENYKQTLKIGAIPINLFVDKEGYVRYIQRNFPYRSADPKHGKREYDKDNNFAKIIEELTKKL